MSEVKVIGIGNDHAAVARKMKSKHILKKKATK